ncbi:uncharacterized protein [Atheta coriaria]|uniref:uncharacterized protein n=1 Tax=Dalotia coriaria TaxID=877792 RepID=UPI0031F42918
MSLFAFLTAILALNYGILVDSRSIPSINEATQAKINDISSKVTDLLELKINFFLNAVPIDQFVPDDVKENVVNSTGNYYNEYFRNILADAQQIMRRNVPNKDGKIAFDGVVDSVLNRVNNKLDDVLNKERELVIRD